MDLKVVFVALPAEATGVPSNYIITKTANTVTVKTKDVIDLQRYNLTEEQAGFTWTIDPSKLITERGLINKSGTFPLDGYDLRLLKEGVGFPAGKIERNIQEDSYYFAPPNAAFNFGSGRDNVDEYTGRIGFFVLRRQNEIETEPNLLILVAPINFNVQYDGEFVVYRSMYEMVENELRNPVPFTISFDGPTTISGSNTVNLTFTVNTSANTLPSGWGTFYLRSNKGHLPLTVKINNKKGIIPFDPSDMAVGEHANIRLGLDWLRKSRMISVTKVG